MHVPMADLGAEFLFLVIAVTGDNSKARPYFPIVRRKPNPHPLLYRFPEARDRPQEI